MTDKIKLADVKQDFTLLIRVVSHKKKNGEWTQRESSNFTVYPKSELEPERLSKKIEEFLERFKT